MTDTPNAATLPDHREAIGSVQTWVTDLLGQVRADQLDGPTPCTEWDVRDLVRHLFALAGRLEVMGHGQPAAAAPSMVDDLPDDLVGGYRERTARGRASWTEESLGRMIEAPFGTVPGAIVLGVYLSEHLVHGWDLAVATGQDVEGDPQLSGATLAAMQRALPPGDRSDTPFGPEVESAPDAGPTERLANFLGRRR